jgi:aminoglycoside phosphotransferase (APT) family kinase protein
MIEELYNHLLSLDDFNDLSPHDIHVESLQTLEHSEVYRIRVDSPRSNLILKKAGPSDVAGLAERERRFYRHIAPLLPGWLVPECVLVVDGDRNGMLFIEDLSGSHQPASSPVPTRVQCRYFVEALATLHGQTGSRSTVQSTWTKIAGDLPASAIEQRLSFFELALGSFIAMIRDRVDHEVASFLTGLSDLEEQIQRLTPQENVLVHGDAHFANALFSPAPNACLIDWGMPMIGFGEIDLAHALALNLPRHLRREWEEEMLSVYLDQMADFGSTIDKETLYERYRLGVLYSFTSPIVWWRSGVPDAQWWPALGNSLDAARDLGFMN